MIGALAILGAVLGIRSLARSKGRGEDSAWSRRELGLVLVLQQELLLPLLTVGGGAVIYDAAGQHLYVLPAVAILAGVGAGWVWRWTRDRAQARIWPVLATAALSLALVVPMAEQTALFPYNYAYVNPLAGIDGVNGEWETDYWFASLPEALSRVPRGVGLRCGSLEHPSEPQVKPEFRSCGTYQYFPFEDRRGTDPAGSPGKSKISVISQARGGRVPPPYCEEVGNVTRWLRGESVTMTYVLRCDAQRVNRRIREEEVG